MSKIQRGNKEARKPKKARPLVEDAVPVAGLPMMAVNAPSPKHKRK